MNELKNLIENNYGYTVQSVEKIKNAYKINTDRGIKCFKASKFDINQFEFIIGAITHLMDNKFDGVIDIQPTINNKNYVEFDKRYGFLCDWIDSREANFGNPIELRMCINTLSKLHIASKGFKPKINIGIRNLYGKWIKRFKKRCDELLYFKALITKKDHYSEFDNIYLECFDIHYNQGLKTIKDLERSNYLDIMDIHKSEAGLCHHDTANHNFLITSDLKMYVIDFDYCIFDTHMHDLASIIIRNLKYGNWNVEVMNYIIDIYSKNIPVSDEELFIIFCFMEFPQDFWQVGLQYYVENQAWGDEFFIKKLNRITIDSKERWGFLTTVQKEV